jgi:hypothetical protein
LKCGAQGKTVLVTARRLSTIVNAHEILVMEHGRIIERGNLSDQGVLPWWAKGTEVASGRESTTHRPTHPWGWGHASPARRTHRNLGGPRASLAASVTHRSKNLSVNSKLPLQAVLHAALGRSDDGQAS